jgi:2-aminoadipate transaminase
VLEELGRGGWLRKLLRRTRQVYEHKLDVLRRAAEQHFPPQASCVYPEGGMSLWVELPPGLDAAELLVKAQDRGVIFAPGCYFYFQQPQHNAFRLCFTALPDEQIAGGIEILGGLLKAEIRKNGRGRKKFAAGENVALV